jgi:hypothetical protein
MASRDKKRSINKRNKKKFYTTTKSKVACTKRRRSLTKFGKSIAAAKPTKLSVGYDDLVKGLVKDLVTENGSNVGLQKLIDKDFPFVSEIKPVENPEPISIPRNSEVFKRYQKSIRKIRKTD